MKSGAYVGFFPQYSAAWLSPSAFLFLLQAISVLTSCINLGVVKTGKAFEK